MNLSSFQYKRHNQNNADSAVKKTRPLKPACPKMDLWKKNAFSYGGAYA